MADFRNLENRLVRVVAVNQDEGSFGEQAGLGGLRLSRSVGDAECTTRRRTHRLGEVEFDFVVEVFEVELAVLHARQQAKDEEMPALPPKQILDRRELSTACVSSVQVDS